MRSLRIPLSLPFRSHQPTRLQALTRPYATSPKPSKPRQPSPEEAARTREAYLSAARARRIDRLRAVEKASRSPTGGESRAEREAKAEEEVKEKERAYKERYKGMTRRWVSGMIALPIVIVTSWFLFDRLALGHEMKVIPKANTEE